MVFLSVTGLVRMVLLILGVYVLLRFFNRIMAEKSNKRAEATHRDAQDALRRAKMESERDKGRVRIVDEDSDAEDVDYEEI